MKKPVKLMVYLWFSVSSALSMASAFPEILTQLYLSVPSLSFIPVDPLQVTPPEYEPNDSTKCSSFFYHLRHFPTFLWILGTMSETKDWGYQALSPRQVQEPQSQKSGSHTSTPSSNNNAFAAYSGSAPGVRDLRNGSSKNGGGDGDPPKRPVSYDKEAPCSVYLDMPKIKIVLLNIGDKYYNVVIIIDDNKEPLICRICNDLCSNDFEVCIKGHRYCSHHYPGFYNCYFCQSALLRNAWLNTALPDINCLCPPTLAPQNTHQDVCERPHDLEIDDHDDDESEETDID